MTVSFLLNLNGEALKCSRSISGRIPISEILIRTEEKNSHIKHQRLDVHDMSFETVGTFDIVFRAGDSTTYGIHRAFSGMDQADSLGVHKMS